jgi:hypothetical protein
MRDRTLKMLDFWAWFLCANDSKTAQQIPVSRELVTVDAREEEVKSLFVKEHACKPPSEESEGLSLLGSNTYGD